MVHAAHAYGRRLVTRLTAAALDRAFAALANPTRRGIVDQLRRGPRRPSELSTVLSVSPPALSRHLRILRGSGLVLEGVADDDQRARVYRLRRELFTRLREWVDRVDALWTQQLTSFAEHVGRTGSRGRRS